ncbi:type II toxin-antitoxin system prevent-host-death family antitoxin [Duganella sp. BJB488]|uniref:type II toxin-antitoxin system Phd/YefM family antitoxin n=1 Tax=unclassified Duganella TaxID=2636909 RepID=UPI000E34178F|nr:MULTISPECIES: type II toxin-antitoxin system prevent-host-death family antitoxin [unclassified Duganella]RFP20267.1 type II toxin-antitoxin system prevent-host-death family antitoxin [Duganella sp. BJB489]RFP21287.1 type II toxin-antitoxin system prevent-host-death family antitoxin [Duganella sp. BJB488]RFP33429.1 type II toxin-antitoxin system prevent-host-death family antitoxin [Duganella sp. BJB480]
MRAYGVYEAKTKLADLIKRAQQGERITITNRGAPVADLVPSVSSSTQQTRDAIAAIKSARTGKITQVEFVEMRTKGRR